MAAISIINSSFLFLFLQIYNHEIISLITFFCFAESPGRCTSRYRRRSLPPWQYSPHRISSLLPASIPAPVLHGVSNPSCCRRSSCCRPLLPPCREAQSPLNHRSIAQLLPCLDPISPVADRPCPALLSAVPACAEPSRQTHHRAHARSRLSSPPPLHLAGVAPLCWKERMQKRKEAKQKKVRDEEEKSRTG